MMMIFEKKIQFNNNEIKYCVNKKFIELLKCALGVVWVVSKIETEPILHATQICRIFLKKFCKVQRKV